jgi:prepilin signal peptidase PulO-like enzyme (type II secretory pathway)
MRAILCKSFGILALLGAGFAALATRGPWLRDFPPAMILAPIAAAIVLTIAGIALFCVSGPSTPMTAWTLLLCKILIGAAALGGLVLTAYFHGNSAQDQAGVKLLHQVAEHFLILVPAVTVVGAISWWIVRKSSSSTSKTLRHE